MVDLAMAIAGYLGFTGYDKRSLLVVAAGGRPIHWYRQVSHKQAHDLLCRYAMLRSSRFPPPAHVAGVCLIYVHVSTRVVLL